MTTETPQLTPEEIAEASPCHVVPRKARKAHTCWRCLSEIRPGDRYLECLDWAGPYQSGSRYCLLCAPGELILNHPRRDVGGTDGQA